MLLSLQTSHIMSASVSVDRSLSGIICSSQGLKFHKSIRAVVRSDISTLISVRLISGGGSGHEPGQSGYVGQGMLTGAVCGDLFASPSVSNILATIKLMGPPGTDVLLIVTNYTGDRLNFGLAAEMAKEEYNIKTLLVDDDCAIDSPRRSVGRRGLAGTILMHKICGAMAERGKSLGEIHEFANEILKSRKIRTIGCSFDRKNSVLNADIGRGLHGEPGLERLEDTSFGEVVKVLLEKLGNDEREVVLMFNNLGGTSELAFNSFIGEFWTSAKFKVKRVLRGSFFTSLSTDGLSVTVLDASPEVLQYIDAPIDCNTPLKPLIPNSLVEAESYVRKRLLPQPPRRRCFEKQCLLKICETLRSNVEDLNEMDAEFGDGDTGTLVQRAAEAVENAMDEIEFTDRSSIFHDLNQILLKAVGGSFGVVLCLFLQGAMHEVDWYGAVKSGVRVIQKYTMVNVGDRTVVDVLRALEDQLGNAERDDEKRDVLEALVRAAEETVEATKKMVPRSGRAAYVFSNGKRFESHFPDPGAQVASLIIKSIYETYLEEIDNEN